MDKPEIFLSCVTSEFGTTREKVASALKAIGYEATSQDSEGTQTGDLRDVLRGWIDRAVAVVHIVGDGYGAEPPSRDPKHGRVSYTQFEFHYARDTGKRIILILPREGCKRDRPLDLLDLPPAHEKCSDPKAWQRERRDLQATYLEARRRDGDVFDEPDNLDRLLRYVERSRSFYEEAIKEWREFKSRVESDLKDIKEVVSLTPERLRSQLRERATEARDRQLAEAEQAKGWQERERLRQAAQKEYEANLGRIEQAVSYCEEVLGRGDATALFREMIRIQDEEGLEQALAFVESRRGSILDSARTRAAAIEATHDRIRAELQPLVASAQFYAAEGRFEDAASIYNDLLKIEPNWPDLLHRHFWFLVGRCDRAVTHENLHRAMGYATDAEADVRRLIVLEPKSLIWQRDLSVSHERIGEMEAALGRVEAARESYGKGLAITERLAASDPANAQWQRDLSVSHNLIGDMEAELGRVEAARESYGKGLAIRERLAASDPANAQWQRDLWVSHNKIGNMEAALGRVEAARERYGKALAIAERLAASDPANAEWQRDLSVSHNLIGDMEAALGRVEAARERYGKALAIAERLAASDPANAEWQRDLSVSHNKIGDMEAGLGRVEAARESYGKGLAIRERLAASDPANAGWQRDLSVSHEKIGNMEAALGRVEAARESYSKGLAITERLAVSDPANAQWQRDWLVSYEKIGDSELALKNFDEAEKAYLNSLEISKRLVSFDPANAVWQRTLWVSYQKVARFLEEANRENEAKEYWVNCFRVLTGMKERGMYLSPRDEGFLHWLKVKLGDSN